MIPRPRLPSIVGVGGRFLIAGAVSTAIEVASFNLFLWLGWPLLAAKVTASLIALVNSYLSNREWTFRGRPRRRRWVEVGLFVVTNGVCTGLGAAIVWLGAVIIEHLTGRAPAPLAINLVNLIGIAAVVLVRFGAYHWGVFRDAPRPAPDRPVDPASD
ncbi:GtrA family protein [Galbitalea sp. SE-J8]|uniref:GtrA family protein n=1 Tax=Galbitalea sp. SE-J8 TaxID=3054952 RepID=UPI00259D0381|nr:GtrA family protein [Galbitalea sp. SE-J8]MDM4761502.1 GtrA family protein [Galbitalea sp. SE-J8]